jgi:hypothetical protein
VAAGVTPLAVAAVGAAEDEAAGTAAAGAAIAAVAGSDGDAVAEGAAGSLKFAPERLAM